MIAKAKGLSPDSPLSFPSALRPPETSRKYDPDNRLG